MDPSMLLSNVESRSGEGSCLPMPEIQSLMFTVAGGSVAVLVYFSPANFVLGTGLVAVPLQ